MWVDAVFLVLHSRKEEVTKATHGCCFHCHPGYIIYPVYRSQEVDLSSSYMCRQQPLVVRLLGSLKGVDSKLGAVAERHALLHEQFDFRCITIGLDHGVPF
jgi:hypothetical protein